MVRSTANNNTAIGVVCANVKLRCRVVQLIIDVFFNLLVGQVILHFGSVKLVVLISTFPSDHVEVLVIVALLHDKLKLNGASSAHHIIIKISAPDMIVCPLHLLATTTIVTVWIPVGEDRQRAKHPQRLAKTCFISDANSQFFEGNLILWSLLTVT